MIGSLLFHWCRTRSHQVKSAGSANVTRLRPNKRSNRALPGFGPGLTGFDGFCRVFHRFEWLKLCWMPTRFSLVGKKRVSFFVPRAGLIVFCFCLARRHLRYRANNENSKKKERRVQITPSPVRNGHRSIAAAKKKLGSLSLGNGSFVFIKANSVSRKTYPGHRRSRRNQRRSVPCQNA